MPLSHVASQKSFLYTHKWDSKKDNLLIISLLAKKEACKPLLPTESPHAIIHSMDALNNTYKAGFRVHDVVNRIEFLRKRYETFKELTNMVETDWEMPKNVVHADDAVWLQLFEEKSFYQAYYRKGEPEYFRLARIFGANDVKEEASRTVIIIEDSPTGVKEISHFTISDTSSEDDVTYPVPSVRVSRKLFADDACSSVSPIVSDYPTHAFAHPPSSNLPSRNVFPPKPKENEQTPDSKPGASSCASSSPFK